MSARQILSNTGALALARGVTASLTLVTTVYLGRVLGPDAYGMLSWGLALLTYFFVVPNLGLNVYGVRAAARDRELVADLAGRILALRLLLATLTALVLSAVVLASPIAPVLKVVVLVQGTALFAHASSVEWAFEGRQRMGLLASRHIAVAVIGTGLVVLAVRGPDDVVLAAAIPPLALLAGNVWLLLTHLRTFGPFTLRWSVEGWRPLVRAGLPIAASLFMVQVYTGTDQVMLGVFGENEDVGLYAAAYRFVTAALIPLHILLQAFAPSLSVLRGDRESMRTGGEALMGALIGVGLPLAVVAAALAPMLMALFGAEYLPAAPSLMILMGSVALGYLHTGLGRALVYWDHEKAYMWALSAGAALNVALNVALIPRYAGPGAAVATLLTELAVLVCIAVFYFRTVRALPLSPLIRGAGAVLVGVVLVGGGLRALGLHWAWQLVGVAFAYPVAAVGAGLLPRPLLTRLLRRSA